MKKQNYFAMQLLLGISLVIWSCTKERPIQEAELKNQKDLGFSNKTLSTMDYPSLPVGCYMEMLDSLAAGSTNAGKEYNDCMGQFSTSSNFKDPILERPATDVLDDYMLLRDVRELAILAGIDTNTPITSQINEMNTAYGVSISLFNTYFNPTYSAEKNLFTLLWHARENNLHSIFYSPGAGVMYPSPNAYFIKALVYAYYNSSGSFDVTEWIEAGLNN